MVKLIITRDVKKEGLPGWSLLKSIFRKNDFVDMIISIPLLDLSFIRNQTLKSADD